MISLETLKAALEITDSNRDILINEMIPRALAFIETYTGRYFGETSGTEEIVPGTGTRSLWLTDLPVSEDSPADEIPSVVEHENPGDAGTTILADDDNGFTLRTKGVEARLVRKGGGVWTRGYEYAVAYTRGYEVDAGPADIEQVVIDLIGLRLNTGGERAGLRSETIGGYSYTRFGDGDLDALPGAQSTLDAWRRPVLA